MTNISTEEEMDIQNGINILDLAMAEQSKRMFSPINQIETVDFLELANTDENVTSSEVLTFYPSLFQTKPTIMDTTDNGLFTFERKLAATSYDRYAKNIVTDLSEFVSDALKK